MVVMAFLALPLDFAPPLLFVAASSFFIAPPPLFGPLMVVVTRRSNHYASRCAEQEKSGKANQDNVFNFAKWSLFHFYTYFF